MRRFALSNLLNSDNGVATQLMDLLEPYTESYGILDDRIERFDEKMENVDKRIETIEARLVKKEAYYRKQFSILQETLSTVNYQSSMIANLTNNMNSLFG